MSQNVDHILIGGNQVGLERDVEPMWLPEGAYPVLENAFILRQRVSRKRAFEFFGRLRRTFSAVSIGNTGASAWTFNIYALLTPAITGEPNKEISYIDSTLPLSIDLMGGAEVFTEDPANPGELLNNGAPTAPVSTINYQTGAVTLTHGVGAGQPALITFSYFPTLPVMGIRTRENPLIVNREENIAFDTKYAYTISGTQWVELVAGTTWKGNDTNFFWSTNYYPFGNSPNEGVYFFATNFNYDSVMAANSDPIRYYDNAAWANLTPAITAADFLLQAKVIVPFKGRLLAFNTVEGTLADFTGTNTRFPQRLRFSQVGSPITATAWRSDTPGLGGFIDAPTGEAIVGVAFLKDNLVVYFERSSWLLEYTGDPNFPFYFKQINSELGAEGAFSIWSFDDYAIGVGDKGFHACNGYNTQRMDDPIPQEIFKFQNRNSGPERVYAVRDFYNELVYFSYPQEDIYDDGIPTASQKFPNRVMIYNYKNKTWAKFTDSFTCYGYNQPNNSTTWANATWSWEEATWDWSGDLERAFVSRVMAGNQQGFTLIQKDRATNDKTLTITAMSGSTITSPDHNLKTGDYINIENALGITFTPSMDVYQVQSVTDQNDFVINSVFTGTYVANGTITVLQNFRIATKRFNPYLKEAQTIRVSQVNYLLDRTESGEFEAQLLINENTSTPMPTFSPFDDARRATLPANRQNTIVLTTPEQGQAFQANQEKIWHLKKYTGDAQVLQVTMTLTPTQMQTLSIYRSDFVLHAILFKVSPSGRLVS